MCWQELASTTTSMNNNNPRTIPVVIDMPQQSGIQPDKKPLSGGMEWINWLLLRRHEPGSGPPLKPLEDTQGQQNSQYPPQYPPPWTNNYQQQSAPQYKNYAKVTL